MHKDFINLKKETLPLYFQYYYLVMHMLLFVGQEKWKNKLNLRQTDNENNDLPIQTQTYIWEQDYFLHLEYTLIRAHGAKEAPHFLPLYVSDRLRLVDLMWQLYFMDQELFRNPRKGTVIVPQCSFASLTTTTKEAHEKFGIMVNNPKLPIDEVMSFDPKGFVHAKRKSKGLSRFSHQFLYTNDVLRNLTSDGTVTSRKKEWTTISSIEEIIIKINTFYVSPYDVIQNPFERDFTKLKDYQSGDFKEKVKEVVERAQPLLEQQP